MCAELSLQLCMRVRGEVVLMQSPVDRAQDGCVLRLVCACVSKECEVYIHNILQYS